MTALPNYSSNFANPILDMLLFRESLGYCKTTYAYELKDFDAFCSAHYPQQTCLTKELTLAWGSKRDNENENGHRIRQLAVRQLGQYMRLQGIDAYVLPTEYLAQPQKYMPYLFTDDELIRFSQVIDTIPHTGNGSFEDYTLPVFFRIAYGCGLRPNELFNLRRYDVHFDDKYIFVYFSKTKRDRIVPVTDDLLDICKKYDVLAQRSFPNRQRFFYIPEGCEGRSWFRYRLKKYWEKAGLTAISGKTPRIYDFRHNFATRIPMKWFDDGVDISAMIPFLSAYMGHVQFHSTMYYIHMLPERVRNNRRFDWNMFGSLLPEVPYED